MVRTNRLVRPDKLVQSTKEKLMKFTTFRECVEDSHQDLIDDLDFGKNKTGGQISDLIRWADQNYLIQRVIDKYGNFWIQIA